MANDSRTYFEEAKKSIEDAKNSLEAYKNLFSDVKDIEDEYRKVSKKFDQTKRNRLKQLSNKKNLTKDELSEKRKLLNLEKKFIELQEQNKLNQEAINKAYAKQNKELKEGYGWIDKTQDKLNENGGRVFLSGLNDIKKGSIGIYNTIKKIVEPWGKANQAAANYAKAIGLSRAGMKQLTNDSISFVHTQAISAKYNKSIDELIKLQQTYSAKVGRSISMTDKQKESLVAMSSVMGDDMASDLAAKLENFGLNAIEAGDRVGKMFSNASKKGLSFESVSKNFLENIKIAQNYTFKNGLRGLASMAEKATAIKLNMGQAASFADKVSTVEGSIKTGAQLQVLGGPFAQYSNPMSMLYESLNDMEGLQNRIVNMFGNLGSFNKETGETDISVFNKMRIRQAAQATGMDYSNLIEMINAKSKRNAMGDLTKLGFTENEQELLYNKSTYDSKSGKWGISGINRNFVSIDELRNRPEELTNLINVSKSESEDIKDIAQLLRGWNDHISGLGKQYDAAKAQLAQDLKLGEFLTNQINNISENIGMLKAFVIGSSIINSLSSLVNIFRGLPKLFKGIGRVLGRNKDSVPGLETLDDITINSKGQRIYRKGNKSGKGGYAPKKIFDNIANYRREDLNRNGGKLNRRGLNRTLPRLATKLGGKKGLSAFSKVGKIAKLGGISTGVLSGLYTGYDEFFGDNNHSTAKKIGRTAGSGLGAWGGAAAGAAIGSVIGPVGTLIGGLIGGIAGSSLGKWIGGGFANQKRRDRKKEEFKLTELKGDYSVAQLKRIKEYVDTGNISSLKRRDIKKLEKNKELDVLSQKINTAKMSANNVIINTTNGHIENNGFGEEQMANGGLLSGPSHTNGGMRITGTNKTVEGGEFIVNKKSTRKYFNELKTINSDINSIKPIEPIGKIIKVSDNYIKKDQMSNFNKLTLDPININLNGTIKLDVGNQNIDITKNIINNPTFIRSLTDVITKQLNTNMNGSFNKDKFTQKWTSLY